MALLQLLTLASDSPFTNPEPWDSIVLGSGPTFTWVGRVDFVGAKRSFWWQGKMGPGVKGDINTFRGTHCNHPFTMRVRVWTDTQWQLLPQLLQFFNYDGTKIGADGEPNANPVDIFHPALAILGIYQVLCLEIHAPDLDKERGGDLWMNFLLKEFLPEIPAVNATKTPAATQTPVGINGDFTAGSNVASVAVVPQTQAVKNEANVLGIKGILP